MRKRAKITEKDNLGL